MINPSIDLITCWPDNCDYPLWRYQLRKSRDHFDNVIIVFTKTNKGIDYSDFVRAVMSEDNVTFLQSPSVLPGEDWRNVATNWALKHSDASWVWFTEEDFYTKDGFWEYVKDQMTRWPNDLIAAYQESRMHPCSIFMHRPLLESLTLDFGIIPNVADHFSKIQQQIESMGLEPTKLPEALYYHYNGLSHNWALVSDNQPAVYHDQEFIDYLKRCLTVSEAEIDPTFVSVATRAITAYNAVKNQTPLPSPTEKNIFDDQAKITKND